MKMAVNTFRTTQEIPDMLECYPFIFPAVKECKTIEEKLIKPKMAGGKMFKKAKEPREEGKANKWVSDKNHGSLFGTELGDVGLSNNGVNMPNRQLFARVSGSTISRL